MAGRRAGKAEPAGPEVLSLFTTRVYRAALGGPEALIGELEAAALSLAEDDEAGLSWCAANAYAGYTSYASLNDLPWRMPPFKALAKRLDGHVAAFAEQVAFDLGGRPLTLDSLWVNVLPKGAGHSGHIHPHSAVSGTLYVVLPKGASPLKLEDPRLGMMMAAPPRRKDSPQGMQPFVYLTPAVGEVVLWESWLRHEVPANGSREPRISVSFNYRWG
jgi:uncharacterized protein (TIGR02466 family)